MIGVLYDIDGRIVGTVTGPINHCESEIARSTYNGLLTNEPCSHETHYVDSDLVMLKPSKPSSNYVFNYATKTWDLDLDGAKAAKWKAIKLARDAEEFGTFEWGGYIFQCDPISQQRLQGAVQLSHENALLTLDWTLENNSVQTFTAAEYIAIGDKLADHVNAVHVRGRMLRIQINECTDEAGLEAIVW